MLQKTPEFLDTMCKAGSLHQDNWYLIDVEDYGFFVWKEHTPEIVFKIENLDMWVEINNINRGLPLLSVSCPVRNVMHKKAKIMPLAEKNVELWINVIIPQSLKDSIRIESYTDQNAALVDAEAELGTSLEVHTRRLVVKVQDEQNC
jgi:hypothetical protein